VDIKGDAKSESAGLLNISADFCWADARSDPQKRTELSAALAIRRPQQALSFAAGERIVDEMLFDEVAVNPKLTNADFSR